ncbi:hypothetical protein AB833_04630 [Chromatiales bacterium (ex Bugula neritina AB1)]|nr:hypothetical protein AB833_04630 [Chromatiales bacterium (ex Bugula neritina AB1)]
MPISELHSTGDQVDVVIVGCGPTGATLALLLARFGVSALILEREEAIYPLPRAVHFDDQIMRVFQSLGVAGPIARAARYNPGMRFVDPSGHLLLDWPRPAGVGENGWYTSYRFHQPDLESILREQIDVTQAANLLTNVEVTGVEQSDSQVNVIYKNRQTGAFASVNASYVVGCDGARSTVRKHINEAVDDLGFNEHWLVVDVLLHQEKPELGDFTIQHCGRDRPATYVRCPADRRRWEISLKPEDNADTIARDDSIWKLLEQWLLPHEATIERSAVYEFKSLVSRQWRDRRLFIAGDAAHLTPPFMGQGMCAGIRDVSNLSWKIAACCNSSGFSNDTHETLLDSYQSERVPNVKEYIETAIRLGALINSCDTQESLKRAFGGGEDTVRMKSIVPGLGVGLAAGNETYRGDWFPQPCLASGQRLDERVGLKAVLLITASLLADYRQQYSSGDDIGLEIIIADDEPEIVALLARYEVAAVLVRPDRYLLGSACKGGEVKLLIDAAKKFTSL